MRKKLTLAGLTALMALSISACGNNATITTTEAAPTMETIVVEETTEAVVDENGERLYEVEDSIIELLYRKGAASKCPEYHFSYKTTLPMEVDTDKTEEIDVEVGYDNLSGVAYMHWSMNGKKYDYYTTSAGIKVYVDGVELEEEEAAALVTPNSSTEFTLADALLTDIVGSCSLTKQQFGTYTHKLEETETGYLITKTNTNLLITAELDKEGLPIKADSDVGNGAVNVVYSVTDEEGTYPAEVEEVAESYRKQLAEIKASIAETAESEEGVDTGTYYDIEVPATETATEEETTGTVEGNNEPAGVDGIGGDGIDTDMADGETMAN